MPSESKWRELRDQTDKESIHAILSHKKDLEERLRIHNSQYRYMEKVIESIGQLDAKVKDLTQRGHFRTAKKLKALTIKLKKEVQVVKDELRCNYIVEDTTIQKFQQNCKRHIAKKKFTFTCHRDVMTVLAHGICMVLTACIAPAVCSYVTGSHFFFRPDTAKKLDALENTIAKY